MYFHSLNKCIFLLFLKKEIKFLQLCTEAKILGKEHNKKAHEIKAAIEIRKRGEKTLNREEGTYILSQVYDPLFKRSNAGKETISCWKSISQHTEVEGRSDEVSRRVETKYWLLWVMLVLSHMIIFHYFSFHSYLHKVLWNYIVADWSLETIEFRPSTHCVRSHIWKSITNTNIISCTIINCT